MRGTRDRIMEDCNWTAFMKLKGQTWAREKEEILDEFDCFAQSLRDAGVDYSIIVRVEGRAHRPLYSEYKARDTEAKIAGERPGA
jgi:hypothetical protein